MAATTRSVRLGGQHLDPYAHICALFEGEAEADEVLWSFVRDGLDDGDRVVEIVESPSLTLARAHHSPETSKALESGQLAILSWSETYVSGGQFRGADMAERIRVVLEEGARLGFPATRGIGQMEWARDGVLGIDELVAYEHQLNSIVSRPHVLICAYDMRRHSASRIAAMVAGHQAIFSGGRLRRPDGFGLGSAPRDRILSAASRLFADAGVRAVGVDTLIREAGVAKATFYRQFPSKDDLIVAWLEDPRTRWFDRVRAEAESRASSPRDVVAQLFNVVAEWLEAADYRGCPYLNTAVEIPDPAHRAVPVIQAYLEEIERYLQGAVGAAGYSDSERIGSALQTLLAGSISLGVAHRTNRFALQAREAAMGLLDGTPGNADPAPVATKDRPGQPSARMPTSGSSEP